MDPDACYQRYVRALMMRDVEEATSARVDLLTWLDGNGFEPAWTSKQRESFFEGKAPPPSKTIVMQRSRAAKILDDIRTRLVMGEDAHSIERHLANQYGIEALQKCDGEAHQVGEGRANGNIDNCMCCAPRWGVVGPTIRVT